VSLPPHFLSVNAKFLCSILNTIIPVFIFFLAVRMKLMTESKDIENERILNVSFKILHELHSC
jgi:hypothetical protein